MQATREEDPLLLVLAADHRIQDDSAFIRAIQIAQPLASEGKLVTFGVVPNSPETGYGYIQRGENVGDHAYKVLRFVEKPDLATAKQYLEAGGYDWNSGLFLFKASRYLEELNQHRPDILRACQKALLGAHQDLDFIRLDETAFQVCPDDSVDYAVMEKTADAVVVPLEAGWSDIGSWSALWEVNNKDSQGNSVQGDVLIDTTHNSYIYSQSKLVATMGINNLVVIETKDAVLVANKDQVQKVSQIVDQLKDKGRSEYLKHKKVYRPWGSHEMIAEGAHYRVKKVIVKPKERTAMQIHYHRAEHWVVVSGTARVFYDQKTYLIEGNESTYIPAGVAHAIANACKINPLEIIEVHTWAILDERDIKRINSINDKK
ncbi:Mannose-1-phosphate guanylyltransferase 1 (part 3) [Candidatus Hamiltonella defensa (Bemisia tabaci)]|nr:Mannose-1-phosphate guanylyltransferase 1 (part 3) [Candidatus Hamiltonella defensa (Bemisia tabaci)]